MTAFPKPESKGAPLRALSILAAVWIAGRIIWETLSHRAEVSPRLAQHSSQSDAQSNAADDYGLFQLRNKLPIPDTVGGVALQRKANFGQRNHWLPHETSVLHPVQKGALSTKLSKRLASVADGSRNPQISEIDLENIKTNKPQTPLGIAALSKRKKGSAALSGYFWLFMRQDGGRAPGSLLASPGSSPSQYGGNQVGGILRYRLSGDNQQHVSVFTRASASLSLSGHEELALGAMMKPLPGLPVSLFAEQRIGGKSERNRGTAIYAAGGGSKKVLHDLEVDTYGQAGFLFDDNSTYFFDGSVKIQNPVLGKNKQSLALGAGLWAGGQKGVRRLDVGPQMDIRFPIRDHPVRVSVDWRQRVAGNAEPDSGLALTLTTGF